MHQKLHSFPPILGLVVGAFNEASENVHELVDALAKSRIDTQGLREGREKTGQELAAVVSQIRRTLSCSILRANANCLLSRLGFVGDEANMASKRRRWVQVEEEKLMREREAHWLALRTGHSLVRRGQFLMS